MNLNFTGIRHQLGRIHGLLLPYYKELRIHRLGNQDAWWLEREHEVYRKLCRQYADLIAEEIPYRDRKTSNRVWVLWLQGIDKAPGLVRACYNSLLEQLPDRQITVLSKDVISEFTDLPGYIHDKFEKGIIPMAQYSDLVRANLILNHGGAWIDSTVLLTGSTFPLYTMSLPLFVFKQLNVSNKDCSPIVASSWYIAGYSNSRIIELTQALLWEYWREHLLLEHYFLFHICFAIACRRFPDEWNAIPTFNNTTPHELMFELGERYHCERWRQICRATDMHKLTRHGEFGIGTNYQFILDKWGSE